MPACQLGDDRIVSAQAVRAVQPDDRRTLAGAINLARTPAWERDLSTALSHARGQGKKVVMVDFYTDWCGWCRKLDETTYADPAVQSTLKQMVTVKLDAERDGHADAEHYGVEGFPTVLFLDARGVEVARIPGYLPPGEFLDQLNEIGRRSMGLET